MSSPTSIPILESSSFILLQYSDFSATKFIPFKKIDEAIEYIDKTRRLNILNGISSIQLAPIENILKGENNE